MITYTVITHKQEADAIYRGDKMYIMRGADYKVGNEIGFLVKDGGKPIPHLINDRGYAISYIDKGEPIQDGVTIYGIRRVR